MKQFEAFWIATSKSCCIIKTQVPPFQILYWTALVLSKVYFYNWNVCLKFGLKMGLVLNF